MALALSAVIIIVLTANFVALTSVIDKRLHDLHTVELKARSAEIRAAIKLDPSGQPMLVGPVSDPRYGVPDSGVYWQIRRAGFTTQRSPSLGSKELPALGNAGAMGLRFGHLEDWVGQLHVVELGLDMPAGPPLQITVASERRLADDDLRQIHLGRAVVNLLAGLALVPLVLLAIARVGLPLARLKREIGKLDNGASTSIAGSYPPDVTPLVDKLNYVIGAFRKAAQENRVQTDMLAHNVRGTLLILEDELRRLDRTGDREPALSEIERQCHAIQRYVESYVVKAERTNTASISPLASTNLEETLERMFEVAQRVHAARRLEWELGVGPACEVCCRQRDLEEILFNLLDNAGKWARTRVHCDWRIVGPEESGGKPEVEIVISDDGPGLPDGFDLAVPAADADVDRNDGDDDLSLRRKGLGIGLALTSELTQLNGGELRQVRSVLSGSSAAPAGTSLALRLPVVNA